jgi:galactokinase
VNLIGEHTDYNEGFVFPMALPFDTAIAFSSHDGDTIELDSAGFGGVTLDRRRHHELHHDWAIHLRGVLHLLADSGIELRGWRGSIATDIPTGASLSSSAALEVAAVLAVLNMAGVEWHKADIAHLGQRVENEVLGLPSGIMDQLISATAVRGHASLIDCRTLTASHHPLPPATSIAVMDTRSRRELVDSEYANRRATCERAAAKLGVDSLRDATLADLDRLSDDDLALRRARHVITENLRTLDASAAMQAGRSAKLGSLMSASHTSLRDDYEVSGPELDIIVDVAQSTDGCFGARMTGGGFAGCAVALINTDCAEDFVASLVSAFHGRTGVELTVWICAPGPGASVYALE